MAKTREQKEKILQDLEELFKQAKSVVIIDYYGLKVKEVNQLRKILGDGGCKYLVAKKTLLKRALDNLGLKDVDVDKMMGGMGLIFGLTNEIAPAKSAVQFGKEYARMKIQGGIFDQKLIDLQKVKELASLPSKEQLLTKLIWTIKSPINNLVYVLKGNLRSLVYILNQIKPN